MGRKHQQLGRRIQVSHPWPGSGQRHRPIEVQRPDPGLEDAFKGPVTGDHQPEVRPPLPQEGKGFQQIRVALHRHQPPDGRQNPDRVLPPEYLQKVGP